MPEPRSTIAYAGLRLYAQIVRWAFARFYREFAWTYDTVAWLVSRGLWRRWATSALGYSGEGKVLELGCGTGYAQYALAIQRPGDVVGLDASPQMIALTRQRLQRAGLTAPLVRGMAQALPFRSGSFNTILATFPSEYILHPATLEEIRRVLVAGGRFILVDGACFTGNGLYERLVDLAYRFTGQQSVRQTAVPDIYLRRLEQTGLRFTARWQTVASSQVMVLVGQCDGKVESRK